MLLINDDNAMNELEKRAIGLSVGCLKTRVFPAMRLVSHGQVFNSAAAVVAWERSEPGEHGCLLEEGKSSKAADMGREEFAKEAIVRCDRCRGALGVSN